MRGCLCSYERVPAGPGSSVAKDPKAPGPSLIRYLFLLPPPPVTWGVPELDVQTSCQGKHFISFAVQKREPIFDFRLIGLLFF